ncbi:M42 family metallopeptidase [Halanaerobiaceae bacterium Z-7014]|uniref:M42 family metallopeptidase n=1 Tax=Halonatronomonas betaini TaxID=2778430 RepID=A0A931APS9_9FIRM|nr:M42 family metallopeptidase [Halonatronomonas betaini]MBF8436743.1 M42 family metallopeptidase [Halonatronomonas betaini]
MLLEKMINATGISSREKEIRDLIREEIKDNVDEIYTDKMGNLIASKGKEKDGPKVMLAAHMDEVGLMITEITSDGLLKFQPVGGIDKRVLVSKPVLVGEDKMAGVIGAKAIHLQKKSERDKPIDFDNLYIDIGVNSKKEAEKHVDLGDVAVFSTKYEELGNGRVIGKAFDDRVGCSIIAELTEYDFDMPVYFVFTVQEEVGLRGAGVAAFDIAPDLALVLEGTTAADVPENKEHRYSTSVGKGPALTLMDRTVIADKNILTGLIEVAEDNGIDYQFRRTDAGGNDAGAISLSREGVPSAVISLPCRYIHSPLSLIDLDDYNKMNKLVKLYLERLARKGI